MLTACYLAHPSHFDFHSIYLHRAINKLLHPWWYVMGSLTFLPPKFHNFSTFFPLKPCTIILTYCLLSYKKCTYFWLLLTNQPFLSSHENVLQTSNTALFLYEVNDILPRLSQILMMCLCLSRVNQSRPEIGL